MLGNRVSEVDGDRKPSHDGGMETITRPELDAKIELIEARADARMSRFEERIDAALAEMRRDRSEIMAEIRAGVSETRGIVSNMKTTTIVTGVSAVLAIVFGVAVFNATLLSNMTASFESGRSSATAMTQATEQMRQTQEQLKAIQERLDQQAQHK